METRSFNFFKRNIHFVLIFINNLPSIKKPWGMEQSERRTMPTLSPKYQADLPARKKARCNQHPV